MKSRRILFVINHAGFFLSHRLPIALAAREAGYDVHIATPRSKHVPQITATGLPWHSIRMSRSSVNPVRELQSIVGLYRLYLRLTPDLVHHVTSKPVLYGTAMARLAGVPAVVNAISGLGLSFTKGGFRRSLLRRVVSTAYRIMMSHRAMRVIFQNREQADDFVAAGRVRNDQIVLIPGSGVDVDQFVPASRGRRTPHVVLASRMLYSKGVGEFVDAARRLRAEGAEATFSLVGEPDADNPDSIPLEVLKSWDAEGVVRYHGRRDDMASVFAETDIACLPTYYGEGVPKVLIEAAASGLPAVTTDWPGCRDAVRDGVTGLLVPPRDVVSLANALRTLIGDAELRERLGEAARKHAVDRFSVQRVITQTLGIYGDLLR